MVHISPELNDAARSVIVWERISAQRGVDSALQSRAAVELQRRMRHWRGDYLPRPSRFKNRTPIERGDPLLVPADPIELLIVRAVAMTHGAAQFGVSPNGAVFTAMGEGWTIRGPRVDVTRLSWLLDEAADIVQQLRSGRGGRFYERGGRFFLADGKTTFLRIVDEAELAAGTTPPPAEGWWRQLKSSVLLWLRDDEPATAVPGTAVPALAADLLRARQAPLRRRVSATADRAPLLCPVHHVEMPATGRCDECS
jgi:hypothetical protein